jgi:BirA family transcriptional regulator, biotin operon repressor / biotin---[acetyl-CoA-carboxylase] ligase
MSPHPALQDLHSAAESVWQAVAPVLPGLAVEVLPQMDSTNAELMRRARQGMADPVLLTTPEQTAGRGRQGKVWLSAPGASLTFSLGLPLAPQAGTGWSGLSLAVGVSVARALHPAVQLKWPNDLWVDDHKLGGILVETASIDTAGKPANTRYAVVGVGLNIQTPTLPANVTGCDHTPRPMPPTSVQALDPCTHLSAGQVLARVAPALLADLLRFEREGFAAFMAAYAQRDALKGRTVRLSDEQEGEANGVAPDGCLWLLRDGQRTAISHQEVSVRPC